MFLTRTQVINKGISCFVSIQKKNFRWLNLHQVIYNTNCIIPLRVLDSPLSVW